MPEKDRKVWIDFVYTVRLRKDKIWDVLKPMLKKYVRK